jgi:hypothetical protein
MSDDEKFLLEMSKKESTLTQTNEQIETFFAINVKNLFTKVPHTHAR